MGGFCGIAAAAAAKVAVAWTTTAANAAAATENDNARLAAAAFWHFISSKNENTYSGNDRQSGISTNQQV